MPVFERKNCHVFKLHVFCGGFLGICSTWCTYLSMGSMFWTYNLQRASTLLVIFIVAYSHL
jgi:hypothetical protein